MSSISSIDTSLYPGLIEGFVPKSMLPVEAVKADGSSSNLPYYSGGNDSTEYDYGVDLSNYYSNIRPEDLLSQIGQNVVKSAEALDNAMVSALQNGYGVNEACNIRLAQMAYRANSYVFEVVNKLSTFEIDV